MALPTYVASGAVFNSAAAGAVALPASIQADDILLLEIETANQAVTITNQNGGTWTEVTNSPQGTGTAAGTTSTRLTIFWSRYNGTQGNPSISDSGDHQGARIHAFRGCPTSGNPWNITSGNVEAASDTSLSATGATTTVDDCLVCIFASLMDDAQDFGGTWTNASLANITVRQNSSGAAGNDWRHILVTGEKASAGTYNATTNTLTAASVKAMLTIALAPDPNITVGLTGVVGTGAVGSVYRPFSDIRQEIINGLDSAQSESNGWDAVRSSISPSDVVRTSNTVVTITLPALSNYDITAQETVTATVPGSALAGGTAVVATPTFTIDPVSTGEVAVTGVGATSGRGSVLAALALGITGVLASSAVGSVSGDRSIALTGVASTSAVGSVVQGHANALTGNGRTSAVGTITLSWTAPLTGNAGTGAVGTVVPEVSGDHISALTGVSATAAVGNVSVVGDLERAITGVSSTSALGTIAPALTTTVTGTQATGALGTISPAYSRALSGLVGTSALGAISPDHETATSGVAATTGTGTIVIVGDRTVAVTGVSAQGLVGTVERQNVRGVIPTHFLAVSMPGPHFVSVAVQRRHGSSIMDTYTADNDTGTADSTEHTADDAPMRFV